MQNNQKVVLGILVLLVGVFGILVYSGSNKSVVRSVAQGSSYQSVMIATGLQGTSGTLCSTSGVLGSIVITGAAAGTMEVYDATTSNSALRTTVATTSLTKVASIPTSAAANTYTFDANSYSGLIWEATGVKATTTLTYRCY